MIRVFGSYNALLVIIDCLSEIMNDLDTHWNRLESQTWYGQVIQV